MSDDLISRLSELRCQYNCFDENERDAYHTLSEAIKAISAQLEQRGKWVKDGETYALYKCSACNEICPEAGWANCIKKEQMYKTFKFCPHCGARMEGQDERA